MPQAGVEIGTSPVLPVWMYLVDEECVVTTGGAGFDLDDSLSGDVESALKLDGDVYPALGGYDSIGPAHALEIHEDGPSESQGFEEPDVEPSTKHTTY